MIENLFTFVRTLGNQRIEGKKFFVTQVGVLGTLSDSTNSVGTTGKVLSSTGSGVEWISVGSSNVADLDDLSDVIITTASTGQLLRFNGTSWVNWTPNFLTAYGSLNDLSDAVITSPATGQLLRYNGTNWVNWTNNFLTTSANLNDLANVSVAGSSDGQILRYNAGTGLWIADDEGETQIPTLQQVTNVGNTTTTGITAGSFTTTGAISGGNITGTKVTTPTVEFNGVVSTNSVEQVDQGDPNPNVFYAKWNGNVQFTVNGDGYAIARTGYKVTGATGGFLKANGTIDTNTYLTSYTETQTLDAVTDLGSTTTNIITVGGVTVSAGGSVTSPIVYSPTLWSVNGPIRIMADEVGSLQPTQGDPANPAIYFEWMEGPLGHIDTDGKITLNGFKTPTGTSSGFLKADGSIDTNTYLTSVAPYALDDLTDVNASNPQGGEFLKFDDATGEWINASIPVPTLDSVTDAGNTTTNTIKVGGATSPYFLLDVEAGVTEEIGMISWDSQNGTAKVTLTDEVSLQVGQEQHWYVKNMSGAVIPNGTVVMAVGTEGASGHIRVAPMIADGTVSHKYVLGVSTADIENGFFGYATTFGKVRNLDTSMFPEGAILYCDPINAGGLTDIQPVAPNLDIPIAFVARSQASTGILAVRVNTGFTLGELHDVDVESAVDGNVLTAELDGVTNTIVWKPKAVPSTDKHYTHTQGSASATWTITHNLGKNPSISAVDSAGTEVIGEVYYVSLNQLIVYFTEPFSGKAYLN